VLNDRDARVTPLQYTIQRGEQADAVTYDDLKSGEPRSSSRQRRRRSTASVHSAVKYDLIGKLAEGTQLTRHTIAAILKGMNVAVFSQYKTNPEDFIAKAGTLINEQKATAIVEHIAYDPVEETYGSTSSPPRNPRTTSARHSRPGTTYTTTCSPTRAMSERLSRSWTPAPRSSFTPSYRRASISPLRSATTTRLGHRLQEGKVKHVYFIAETKGSMSTHGSARH
jgi:type III restriction enzyme